MYICIWTDWVGEIVFDDGIWRGKGDNTKDLHEFVSADVPSAC